MSKAILRILPLGFFIILSFVLWRGLSLDPHKIPSPLIGKAAPALNLPDVFSPKDRIRTTQLRGKLYLLNVWASGCDACEQEHALLTEIAKTGIPIYGWAYKDSRPQIKAWLKIRGNPYQKVFLDEKGATAMRWGVYGTPETFLVDAHGIIVYKQIGPMTRMAFRNEFLPRIAKAKEATL